MKKEFSYKNEKNEQFSSMKNYKSAGRQASKEEVQKLISSGEFWLYNGFNLGCITSNEESLVMMEDNNCVRRLTSSGYVTIALRTKK